MLLCAAGLGAWAWLRARAEEEKAYGDIDRSAYEAWMQDLGYTE